MVIIHIIYRLSWLTQLNIVFCENKVFQAIVSFNNVLLCFGNGGPRAQYYEQTS